MYWLLNSAVIAVGGDGNYNYTAIDKDTAIAWLQSKQFISRIGYPDTQQFIQRLAVVRVALSREGSLMQAGDEALVVRPSYRLQSVTQKGQFRPEDSDFVFGILRRLS